MRIEDKGEYTGLRESRTHIAHFTKSLRGSAAIRGKINFMNSLDEVESALLSYADELEKEY
jgi:tRNA-dihydrouridine synthase